MQWPSYKTISGMAGILVVVSVIPFGQKESHFTHNPQVYDARSEHIIPLDIRGTGTVYLTPAESQSLEPYVYATYAALALLVIVAGVPVVVEAYRGFMRGWRRK